ncbi:MAG: hypothetical protein M3O91_00365 [Chloroflexota bacterium]|nr:hypothetical protein [Chloroflexota bacterium]
MNEYLREITGQDFTAKDFRTWAGTFLAARSRRELEVPRSARGARRNVLRAIDVVAERLGNTRAVCRRCYVHPAIVDAYSEGKLLAIAPGGEGWATAGPRLRSEEAAVVTMFRRATRESGRQSYFAESP